MVSSGQIDLGEDSRAWEVGGEVLYVGKRVPVWNGVSVQSAVISSWSPVPVLLADHRQLRGPAAGGWSYYLQFAQFGASPVVVVVDGRKLVGLLLECATLCATGLVQSVGRVREGNLLSGGWEGPSLSFCCGDPLYRKPRVRVE